MIRILHIVHALTRSGGLSNFLMNYYRNINRDKVQFDFIYFKDVSHSFSDEIEQMGGRCFQMTEPAPDMKYRSEIKAFFQEHEGEYTAMHCHALFAAAMYAGFARKYGGISNIIIHSHSNGYGNGTLRKIRNYFMIKAGVFRSDYKMACSYSAARFMFGERAAKNGEVMIINNAIDCERYLFDKASRDEIRKELDIGDAFVIGHVGGFAVWKNHDFLIDVFSCLKKIRPDAILILAGDEGIASGSTKSAVIEKAKSLGLMDSIRILGFRNDVNKVLMAMDAFVFPSVAEGFGFAMIEAELSGLRCFASKTVPPETKCTDKAKYLPLEEGPAIWAADIASADFSEDNRSVDLSDFDRFNIKKQAGVLEKLYLDMI